jgi:hypothetical protein
MAGSPKSRHIDETPRTEANEFTALQQKLEAKLIECNELKSALSQAATEKAAAHRAGLLGIQAAKTHMQHLRAQLDAVKAWMAKHEQKDIQEAPPNVFGKDALSLIEEGEGMSVDDDSSQNNLVSEEEDRTKRCSLQQQIRTLRHELARWKHQVERHESRRPGQEEEIMRLKAAVTHTLDVLESTRHIVKHNEVEKEFQRAAEAEKNLQIGKVVPLLGGGHGSIEAHAERYVREQVEERNDQLTGKAKRLTGVVGVQQALIQRLEKQVLHEEMLLEQKEVQLHSDALRIGQLKAMVRQRSNAYVANMLGVPQRSLSVPRLPAI